ncbi:hypothetical protein BDV35DRAFT_388762 [Aspergillus flavus]|uniref:Berberine/berberine-like domain-containing protein n=1 Tax=Aspergillus flavus TaxID=5059 RepID=A0A5N6HAJ5_ASPFL|nr:hypothetical protein BDV35DRAFT_388762 [Aspergillus flavus]
MRFSGLLVNDNNHQWLGADPRSYRERGSPEICWWTQPAGLAAVGTRIGIQGLCVMWRDMSICLCYVPKHNDSYEAESVANAKGLPLSTNFRVNLYSGHACIRSGTMGSAVGSSRCTETADGWDGSSRSVQKREAIERLLDGDFSHEFSGDAVAVNPEMAPTPVTEPSLVLFWCWILPSGDLTPAKSFLEQTAQAGRFLGNTVTEPIPAAYGLGDSSSGTFFCSPNVDRIYQNVGTILARPPPPHPLPAIIFHNNHDKGIRHRVADTVGKGALRIDTNMSFSASMELEEALDQNGLSLPGGFPAFWRPDQVDIERFSGEEKALRLQQLKARLDPNNLFTMPCPV